MLKLALILIFATTVWGQERITNEIPVLVYHRFDPKISGPTTVTTASLLSQISYLSDHGLSIAPLHQVVDIVLGKEPLPLHPIVAITVDDGHRSIYTALYPIIKQRHIPVTLFIYPSAISNSSTALTWEQIREMQASGMVDVQSHTYWHPDFRKEKAHRTATDYASFVDSQLTRSRKKLEEELGTQVDLLAWPYGILGDDLEAAARRAGYHAAFAYDGKLARPGDDPMAIHRVPVSDIARGGAFAALLHSTHSNKEKDHANRE